MTRKDAQQMLGVDDKSTPEEIKAAYRTLAKVCHPDKNGTDGLFKTLSDAYDILAKDPGKAGPEPSGKAEPPPPPPPGPRTDHTGTSAPGTVSGWELAEDPSFELQPEDTALMFSKGADVYVRRGDQVVRITPSDLMYFNIKSCLSIKAAVKVWPNMVAAGLGLRPKLEQDLDFRLHANSNRFAGKCVIRLPEPGFARIELDMLGHRELVRANAVNGTATCRVRPIMSTALPMTVDLEIQVAVD